MARRIQVIISHMVPAAECLTRQAKKRLIVDDADNHLMIRDCVRYFIDQQEALKRLSRKIQLAFLKSNKRNIRTAKGVLKEALR